MANVDTTTMVFHIEKFLNKNESIQMDITACVNTTHVISVLKSKGYEVLGEPKSLYVSKMSDKVSDKERSNDV